MMRQVLVLKYKIVADNFVTKYVKMKTGKEQWLDLLKALQCLSATISQCNERNIAIRDLLRDWTQDGPYTTFASADYIYIY